jgi:hypothetical protein
MFSSLILWNKYIRPERRFYPRKILDNNMESVIQAVPRIFYVYFLDKVPKYIQREGILSTDALYATHCPIIKWTESRKFTCRDQAVNCSEHKFRVWKCIEGITLLDRLYSRTNSWKLAEDGNIYWPEGISHCVPTLCFPQFILSCLHCKCNFRSSTPIFSHPSSIFSATHKSLW